MQRDVKIGIAIGVLLIALIAIFWLSRQETSPSSPPVEDDASLAQLPPSEDPIAPEEHGNTYLPESPEAAVAPPISNVAPDETTGIRMNPRANLGERNAPPPIEPSPTQPNTETTAPPVAAPQTHTIKSGDTLSAISQTYYGTTTKWRKILDANRDKIPDENRLRVGVTIVIPDLETSAINPGMVPVNIDTTTTTTTPRTHTVAAGESLSSIAKKYYESEGQWRKIYDANRNIIKDPDSLKQGMNLVIP